MKVLTEKNKNVKNRYDNYVMSCLTGIGLTYLPTVFFFIFYFLFSPIRAQVGTWKNYLSYHDIQQIQAVGDDIFVLASNGLYMFNQKDQSITTYDKTKGLNDVKIYKIAWNKTSKRLVILYDNCNIDLLDTNGNISNISDIYTKAITGDKSINSIYIYNQYAYLACGFGIVKLDVKRTEISESYMLGFAVKNITIENNNIYAKDAKGSIWTASLNNNLIDTSYWQQTSTAPSFAEDTTDYDKYYETISKLNPGGPKYNYFGFMKFYNDKLYCCGGGFSATIDLNREGCIQVLENNNWTIFEDSLNKITGRKYVDVLCLDIDPKDEKHVMAGVRSGIYEFYDGKFVKVYNQDNSPLMSATPSNSRNYVLTETVGYDQKGDLWTLNSQSLSTSIIEYTANKEWKSFHFNELMDGSRSLGAMTSITFDDEGNFWFINNHWNIPSIYRYSPYSNKLINIITRFVNQDGTTLDVHPQCLCYDMNGNLWVGTSQGIFMIEPSQMSESNCVLTQIKVPRNDGTNFADYLLDGINITSIAIDGGNRKWIGTIDNGIYVISDDNMTEVHHFTMDNSFLLANGIESIAINQNTGEVFIGTENGLCSYMSGTSQSNTEMTSDNVYAYPNPVEPGYTGSITITGLTFNADVKIISSNGALIAQGRSNGGSFIWDGCDSKGNRVASGVYMVATATKEGKKGTVCKIAIVR